MNFNAKIINGELDFGGEYNQARWEDFLKENEGKTIKIIKEVLKRTQQQNRFYWLYLDVIANDTGNDPEDLHELFKEKLLPKRDVVIFGKKQNHRLQVPISTTKLNKIQFGEYIEKICRMTGVPIPNPEEAGYYNEYSTIKRDNIIDDYPEYEKPLL